MGVVNYLDIEMPTSAKLIQSLRSLGDRSIRSREEIADRSLTLAVPKETLGAATVMDRPDSLMMDRRRGIVTGMFSKLVQSGPEPTCELLRRARSPVMQEVD